MKKRGEISLGNPVNDELKKGKIKTFNIFLIIGIAGVAIILGIIFYYYMNPSIHNLNYGANIERADIGPDLKNVYIKLSGGINSGNITGVNFIFKDSNGKEYGYETGEGVKEISIPYKTNWWNIFIKPKFLGVYDYSITADKLGLTDFTKITEVDVVFKYKTISGAEVVTPTITTKKPTQTKKTTSTSSGGGTGDSGGNPNPVGCINECPDSQNICYNNISYNCILETDGCYHLRNPVGCLGGTCINGNCENINICENDSGCSTSGIFCGSGGGCGGVSCGEGFATYNCSIGSDGCLHKSSLIICENGSSCVPGTGCTQIYECNYDSNCTNVFDLCAHSFCNITTHKCDVLFNSSSTICRVPIDDCDLQENCTGNSATCPIDIKKSDNSSCPDDSCNTNRICANGVCGGGNPIFPLPSSCSCTNVSQCPIPIEQCKQASCVLGICGSENKLNGFGCSDNNNCTISDSCNNGACVGTPKSCTPSSECKTSSCNLLTGNCEETNKPDDTSCSTLGSLSPFFSILKLFGLDFGIMNSGSKACLSGVCVDIKCNSNSDCGINGNSGNSFCSNSSLYQNYTNFTCNNPGKVISSCSNLTIAQLKQNCGISSCDNFGNNYCKNGSVYHNQTCYNKGCLSGSCTLSNFVNENLVATCSSGCYNGVCNCSSNCVGKSCGDDGCGGSCLPGCSNGMVCNASFMCENNSFSSDGWYSYAKDNHNSRIADDNLTPPLNLKWNTKMPTSWNRSLSGVYMVYQNDRLFAVVTESGSYYAVYSIPLNAFNATTGQFLWNGGSYGAVGSRSHIFLSHGYVFGGVDHQGGYILDVKNGDYYGGAPMDESYNNVDDYGFYTYGTGSGTDHCGVAVISTQVVNQPKIFLSPGKFNESLGFLGDYFSGGDYLNLGNSNDFNPGNKNLTIMLWFKWDGTPGYNVIYSKGKDNYYLPLYKAEIRDGTVSYMFYNDSNYGLSTGNFNCAQNEWCHLTITRDHKYVKLYKDGQIVSTSVSAHRTLYPYDISLMKNELLSRSSGDLGLYNFINAYNISNYSSSQNFLNVVLNDSLNSNFSDRLLPLITDMEVDIGSDSSNLYIGGMSTTYNYNGLIDEFAIFNRSLSGNEINSIYNSKIPENYNGLRVLYHFDNNSYNDNVYHFYDYSGNGNDYNYDGHLNLITKWSNGRAGNHYAYYSTCVGTGVESNWGMVGPHKSGQGQPASNNGTLYVPDGILWAYNITNGNVIWQHGVWPFYDSVGNASYFSEVNYNNGNVYVIGRNCLQAHNGTISPGPTFSISPPKWDIARLYAYNALNGNLLYNISIPDSNITGWNPALYDYEIITKDNFAYVSGQCRVFKFDLNNKSLVWRYDKPGCYNYDQYTFNCQVGWSCHYGTPGFALSGNTLYTTLRTSSIANDRLIALSAINGTKIWEFNDPSKRNLFSEIIEGDNKLFVSTFGHDLYAFEK